MIKTSKKIIIIGGNAAGMSAASRARRNDPDAQITVFEKSGQVSYGSCGLPYFISDDIKEWQSLLAVPLNDFETKRNISVKINHEAQSFDPRKKVVFVNDLTNNRVEAVVYDRLIISTGARAAVPDIPGIKLNNVFVLRSIDDGRRIKEAAISSTIKNAVIIGSGYIGLEMAEALRKQGKEVCVIEQLDQVMPNLDTDMAAVVEDELLRQGCRLLKAVHIRELKGKNSVESIWLNDDRIIPADMVIVAAGIKPNVEFACTGGVELGKSGAIRVNQYQKTNLFNVFAAGDCAEVKNRVTGQYEYIPLGSTANKQGRVAGDNASAKNSRFEGVTATTLVKVFDLEVAHCGIKLADNSSIRQPLESVVIKGKSRAGYYPGKTDLWVKLVFTKQGGRLMGAQMIGREGASKRIDVLATALAQKMTLHDIAELDLSYAPPFAPVWDPILIAAHEGLKLIRR